MSAESQDEVNRNRSSTNPQAAGGFGSPQASPRRGCVNRCEPPKMLVTALKTVNLNASVDLWLTMSSKPISEISSYIQELDVKLTPLETLIKSEAKRK
jgi:hypothetical protein